MRDAISPCNTIGESRGLMYPTGPALAHPFADILKAWGRRGCPVDCGRNWTREEIEAAIERGAHKSALSPEGIKYIEQETKEKVDMGYCKVVYWDEIKENFPPNLKVSPISLIPHKSRSFRLILDLSFSLCMEGHNVPSVNEGTTAIAPHEAMEQLANCLPRIIRALADAPINEGHIIFAKLDIKDAY